MEPIEITVHFNQEGTMTPMHFTWKGSRLRVESTGRRWSDEAGQHLLVMVSNGKIYELIFVDKQGRWYINQVRPDKTVV
jgi:hypothetical protein